MARSIWNLGEGYGHSGHELELWRVACPFCDEEGKFSTEHRAVKKKPNGTKTIVFETLKCASCAGYVLVVWSASQTGLYDFISIPRAQRLTKAPEHWPADVARYWIQAHRSIDDENWDAATLMARSALQVALREQGAVGANLKQEIDDLAGRGLLPPVVKEWAHEVRDIGNDSAHPHPGADARAPQDARDIVKFIDYMFVYLYNLPHEISTYRARKAN